MASALGLIGYWVSMGTRARYLTIEIAGYMYGMHSICSHSVVRVVK